MKKLNRKQIRKLVESAVNESPGRLRMNLLRQLESGNSFEDLWQEAIAYLSNSDLKEMVMSLEGTLD